MAFTWQDEAIEILRVMIDDMEDNPIYCNEKLLRILTVSAFQVANDATFTPTFTVTISTQTLSPDPTATDTKNDTFMNLMCIRAACLIDMGKAIKSAGKAVSGKDMNAVQFDLRAIAEHRIKLLEKGFCQVYKETLQDYLYDSGLVGQAVMSPFRTYAHGYYGRLPFYGNTASGGLV